jgi:hypothetical protein
VLVVMRFEVPDDEAGGFAEGMARAVEALARQPGYRSARLGRAADDPAIWALVTEWGGARAWRKALSAFDVRVELTPLLVFALDEAGAFEVLLAQDGPVGSVRRAEPARAPDAATAAPGDLDDVIARIGTRSDGRVGFPQSVADLGAERKGGGSSRGSQIMNEE